MKDSASKIFTDRINIAIQTCEEDEKRTGSDYSHGYKDGLVWILDLLQALRSQPETELMQ